VRATTTARAMNLFLAGAEPADVRRLVDDG
jgi:hypothetical protein